MIPDRPTTAELSATLRATAIVIVGVAGSAGYLVVPLVIAALRHGGRTPELWIGIVGSADPAGMLLGAAIALLAPVRLAPRRAVILSLIVTLASNAASLASPSVPVLVLLRIASGAGGGVALAMALSLLGQKARPERNFAIISLAQMAYGMLAATIDGAGMAGLGRVYQILLATKLLALASAWALPRTMGARDRGRQVHTAAPLNRRLMLIIVIANICSAAGFMILWANIEALGRHAGVGDARLVTLLNVGLLGGFAGTLLTAVIDGRDRRSLLATALFAVGLLGAVLVGFPLHWLVPFAAVFMFQIAPAAVCYGFGAIAQSDPTGRLPIVHIFSVKLGFAVAPLAGSIVISQVGLDAVVPAAFVVTFLAMIAFRMQIAEAEHDIAQAAVASGIGG